MKTVYNSGKDADIYDELDVFVFLSCTYLSSLANFMLDYTFIIILIEELGLENLQAGFFYGVYSMSILLIGIPTGMLIDAIGVKKGLIAGALITGVSYLLLSTSRNSQSALLVAVAAISLGSSLNINGTRLGVSKHKGATDRPWAINEIYILVNAAALVAALSIATGRFTFPQYAYYRVGLAIGSIALFTEIPLLLSLRDVPDNPTDITEAKLCFSQLWQGVKETARYPAVQEYLKFAMLIEIGTGSISRYFVTIIPEIFQRDNKLNGPYELILLINPMTIIVVMPIVTMIQRRMNLSLFQQLQLVSHRRVKLPKIVKTL